MSLIIIFQTVSVTRPVPLSTFVNRAKRSQAVSHATLISTVLEKVREVRDYDDEPQPSTR